MLKNLWNTLTSSAEESAEKTAPVDANKLQLFASHFRIGRKILYYPEAHVKSVLRTIVMAYRVNDHYLYGNDALRSDRDGALRSFRLVANQEIPLEQVRRFQVLLPDTSEMETKLDYMTRAELGPAGHLRQGNTITLICESADRCVPSVEVVVQRKQVMQDGPFANNATILVTPHLHSLRISDKRRTQRVSTAIWADLYHAAGSPPFPCMLKDFSESSLRLEATEAAAAIPRLETGRMATVEFDFGSADSTYRLRGKIIRHDDSSCVLGVEQIYHDGDFDRIKMIDVVEIKTRLLNQE